MTASLDWGKARRFGAPMPGPSPKRRKRDNARRLAELDAHRAHRRRVTNGSDFGKSDVE